MIHNNIYARLPVDKLAILNICSSGDMVDLLNPTRCEKWINQNTNDRNDISSLFQKVILRKSFLK